MSVITRFAPSPTGFLHIGGARTALFNWLFAKNNGGKFLLRVEDTDKARSTQEAIDAILDGMTWLGLNWNDEVIFQSKGEERHREVANNLLEKGKAYKCYCSKDELAKMREKAIAEKKPYKYNGKCRDISSQNPPSGIDPVIRFKAPQAGTTIVNDLVQGEVSYPNEELDDIILLRADGTPTYMLAVVVDDHDMGVTHAIRGDDHLTNAFRQRIIYEALGWDTPIFAHIPLIHGADGAKLSKRHGALGVDAYRDMGYLPEAMRNYLLRLGWSHGDDEIISTEQAIKWFNCESIGKSPARIDFDKMANVNAHYMKEADNNRLLELILPIIEKKTDTNIEDEQKNLLLAAMNIMKERSKTINELADGSLFFLKRVEYTDKAFKTLNDGGSQIIVKILPTLEEISDWNGENIKSIVKDFSKDNDLKIGKIFQPIRAALCGTMESPDLMSIMEILGKSECLKRLGTI